MRKTANGLAIKEAKQRWHLIDAQGRVLGRLASRIATMLMGKDKPNFTRHVDSGDHVIVINAAKVKVTGRKVTQKMYKSFSGYPGGLKETSFERVMQKDATIPLRHAVAGMLPKSSLAHHQAKKLHIYADAAHPHKAQMPVEWKG